MALSERYAAYLKHFGPTVPVSELLSRNNEPNLVALRHDVDYCIDVALEGAAGEYKAGARASYYILHTAGYWNDPKLIDKCLQLQDFGHEVGLHTNLLAEWHRGAIDDIAGALDKILKPLRAAGLKISGAAAHGDALCYEAGFTNYWLFRDLKPSDPRVSEHGVTAEGSKAGPSNRCIDYPKDRDAVVRHDGKSFPFWSLKLADFGLAYEASRVHGQRYFSDSGGAWKRSPDPIGEDLSTGRNVVLMHPIYWKPPQRHYYFLSTARSGSKWLASFLDAATSVTARHEFTLNHTIEGGEPVADKQTGAGFTKLVADKTRALALIEASRTWSESLRTSYAECNVYLEQFLGDLDSGPATTLIHLQRNPAEVVRSLLQRNWYDVPGDDRHPAVEVEGWEAMSQIEQICWYVADTNRRLRDSCGESLAFETMVTDRAAFSEFLEKIGITTYPRLAAGVYNQRVNETKGFEVAPVDQWTDHDRAVFERIVTPLQSMPRAPKAPWTAEPQRRTERSLLQNTLSRMTGGAGGWTNADAGSLIDLKSGGVRQRMSAKNARLSDCDRGLVVNLAATGSAHVLLGRGSWHGRGAANTGAGNALMKRILLGGATGWGGWRSEPNAYFVLEIATSDMPLRAAVRAICLSYNEHGELIGQRDIGTLSAEWPALKQNFKPSRGAAGFNVALHKSSDQPAIEFVIERLTLTVAKSG